MLTELGILAHDLNENAAYCALSFLIHDPVVRERCFALPTKKRIPYGEVIEVVAAMTPRERIAVRDRVLAVYQKNQGPASKGA
jgi:hypothetical protein